MDNDFDPAIAPMRLDGRAKVLGKALYTGDTTDSSFEPYLQPGEQAGPMLYAAVVQSEHLAGKVRSIDTAAAEAVPGVRLVMTHTNAPRLKKVSTMMQSELTKYLPLQETKLYYHGQPLAVVVADTLEIATHAASLVEVRYAVKHGRTDFDANLKHAKHEKKVGAGDKGQQERGHPRAAYKDAPVQLDQWYTTDAAHHNPIEPAATVAYWHAESPAPIRLTVICSTQFVYGDAIVLGQTFGLGVKDSMLRFGLQLAFGKELDSKVRVVAPLIGGGFGSKGSNSHMLLAAMAAKLVGQPVKLVLTRQQVFSMMPYRGAARQRIRLGAAPDGRLISMLHEGLIQSAETASFVEPLGEFTPHLYAVENMLIDHRSVKLNVNAPGWMRAPGIAPAQFAIESAMDELAEQVGIDPIELRLRNDAEVDPETGHEWSSKSLNECFEAGAKAIGWERRQGTPGTLRERDAEHGVGYERIGYGVATAVYPTNQFPATARLILRADGTVLAQSSAHEIGQGAITVLAQVAAEAVGVPLRKVVMELGDTTLPMAMMAGGSSTTLSVGSALESFYRADPSHLSHRDGLLFDPRSPGTAEAVGPLLSRNGLTEVVAKGIAGRTFGRSPYGRAAFGAQFARVVVDEASGHIRVTRMVGAFAAGRILNARTARSQLLGGMVWGLGQALLEQSVLDTRNGAWVNSNLAEAHVPVNADVPQIDVLMIDEDDSRGSRLGAKGIGELGITGAAAAIANAVYNATGKRIRSLPITLDKVHMD
jgi:xanthine dehydrogenase YagR molybdenum-binding subunit